MPTYDIPNQWDGVAEEAVLGGCLIDGHAIEAALSTELDAGSFYLPVNSGIFYAMKNLYDRGVGIDFITVAAELERTDSLEECGGSGYLASLAQLVPTSTNTIHYAGIVHRLSIERKVGALGIDLLNDSLKAGPDLPIRVSKRLEALESHVRALRSRDAMSDMKAIYEKIWGRLTGNMQDQSLIRTGLVKLNKVLEGGVRRTDLLVIAGRTSQGKTALATTILHKVAVRDGLPCVMYSYEMAPEQVADRVISLESGIALSRIREGGVTNDEHLSRLASAIGKIDSSPLEIVSASGWKIEEIIAHAQARQRKTPLAIVCIDYLQLVTPSDEYIRASRATQIAHVTGECKRLAERANVCVLGLSQLNRLVEIRGGSPELSDLRESGAIEQDANQVLFVYDAPEAAQKQMPDKYRLKTLDLQKNRNGEQGVTDVAYYGTCTRFLDSPPGEAYGNQTS